MNPRESNYQPGNDWEAMETPQGKPRNLSDFQRRDEEVALFEGFKSTERDIHPGFKEPTHFDAQRIEFRAIAPRWVHRSKVTPTFLTSQIRRELEQLQKTLIATLETSSADVDLRYEAETMEWSGVIKKYAEQIRDVDAAASKHNHFRGMVRDGFHVAGGLRTFTDMIPDEKGLSVLKVGLAYILLVGSPKICPPSPKTRTY